MAKISPNRFPLQVSPKFKGKLDELQREIRKAQGENKSLREITDEIVQSPLFDELEKSLIKKTTPRIDVHVKFDRRFL